MWTKSGEVCSCLCLCIAFRDGPKARLHRESLCPINHDAWQAESLKSPLGILAKPLELEFVHSLFSRVWSSKQKCLHQCSNFFLSALTIVTGRSKATLEEWEEILVARRMASSTHWCSTFSDGKSWLGLVWTVHLLSHLSFPPVGPYLI